MRDVLGVFARYPEVGRVKTRLAAGIGAEAAARLYEAFVKDIANHLQMRRERCVLAITPDHATARDWFESLAGEEVETWPQPVGSLGDRLSAFFSMTLQEESSRAVVIGSDSPSFPPVFVEEAFAELDQHDVVVGPAEDGGYYLIGLHARVVRDRPGVVRTIFTGIDWGGPTVLAQTLERLRASDLRFTQLPVWYDVDSIKDLRRLRDELREMDAAGSRCPCPRTRQLLTTLELP